MSFGEHLEELRKRVALSLIALLFTCIAAYFFRTQITELLMAPVLAGLQKNGQDPKLYVSGITEAFGFYIKVSIYAGLFIASPFCLWQAWKFVGAGLYPREKKYIIRFAPVSFMLFLLGVATCYFMMLPLTIAFLFSFTGGQITALPNINQCLNFCLILMLVMGLIFETPLVMLFLSYIGIGNAAFYSRYRRHCVLVSAIIAAVATPSPDAASMLVMWVPMVLLYEIGIIMVRIAGKKKEEKEEVAA